MVGYNNPMEKHAKSERENTVTAVLTKADLKIVDRVAAQAGVSRVEALTQLLRYELERNPRTLH